MSSKTTKSRQQDIKWKTKEEWEAVGYKIRQNAFPAYFINKSKTMYHYNDVYIDVSKL